MSDLKIASVQFENASGDKAYNLAVIDRLSAQAAQQGCKVIAFHECSITGYTFASHLTKTQLIDLAEPVPSGPSTQSLLRISRIHNIAILAGLFELDPSPPPKTSADATPNSIPKIYNTYICVHPTLGFLAAQRKLHPFISPHLSPGNSYALFDLYGWKCSILICYDNNIIENVRATALMGAEILFAPHVTMCTPSSRPGAGFVDPKFWENRERDPTTLREEFEGLKGRKWLMKWLPARAYDNGIYMVFSNPIGMDGDQLKNGCSMVLDPFGDVVAECAKLGDDMAVAVCTREKLEMAGGWRYRRARRPELYRGVIGRGNDAVLQVAWMAGGNERGGHVI
ncbi:carbon-nitrogen hydrolase [Podospora aff. communis PSN243]|uniref:Carbon-nitrogen hydrolase n=1 Tax=Podospora aff. communis PSN243 TaxID=3040156 RepID=A0AAV9GG61_9PEZI|nr:carbon-nitrogen hydrolase [Podospora aff. communis PSN243]